jgi:hypothetical protein
MYCYTIVGIAFSNKAYHKLRNIVPDNILKLCLNVK